MTKRTCPVCAFLDAVQGDWRNTVFIECRECSYGKEKLCKGFLLTEDFEGRPIILTTETFHETDGRRPDKDQCLGVLSRKSFESLYCRWLTWQMESAENCPLLRLAARPCCLNTRNSGIPGSESEVNGLETKNG